MVPTPRGPHLHEEGVGILLAPQEGRPGSRCGTDLHLHPRPRFSMGGEQDVPGVVLEGGVLRACPELGLGQDEDGGAARCHVQGLRQERCRRYRPRTLSHRYPTACTSSGVPSILGPRGAGVLRLRVRL